MSGFQSDGRCACDWYFNLVHSWKNNYSRTGPIKLQLQKKRYSIMSKLFVVIEIANFGFLSIFLFFSHFLSTINIKISKSQVDTPYIECDLHHSEPGQIVIHMTHITPLKHAQVIHMTYLTVAYVPYVRFVHP